MRALFVTVWLIAGCHRVFNLEEVAPVPPAPDAAVTPQYCYPFAVDAAVGSDPDLDFLPSQDDNCPEHANKNQADEDNDCRGDVCDRCPWLATVDPDMADDDQDGLANSCDPDSQFVNNFFFEGFNDDSATVASRFTTFGATWVTSNGAWTHAEQTGTVFGWQSSGTTSNGAVHLSTVVPGGRFYDLEATFMVGSWVLGNVDVIGPAGIRAGLARDHANLWLRIEEVSNGVVTILAQQQVSVEDLGSQLRFNVGYTSALVVLELETRTGVVKTMANVAIGSGSPGPFTVDTTAEFQYFAHIH